MVDLAASAVALVAPYLAISAEKAAAEAGEKAWQGSAKLLGWLRSHLGGRGKEALEDLETNPQSADNQADLRKQIEKLLKAEPELRDELRGLVAQTSACGEAMVQNVSGSGAIGNQIRGNDNRVTIKR